MYKATYKVKANHSKPRVGEFQRANETDPTVASEGPFYF